MTTFDKQMGWRERIEEGRRPRGKQTDRCCLPPNLPFHLPMPTIQLPNPTFGKQRAVGRGPHHRGIVAGSGPPNPAGLAHTSPMTEPDVDYHREKYGLVALAHYLTDVEGWPTVRLSVAAASLDAPGGLNGLPPPTIDPDLDR